MALKKKKPAMHSEPLDDGWRAIMYAPIRTRILVQHKDGKVTIGKYDPDSGEFVGDDLESLQLNPDNPLMFYRALPTPRDAKPEAAEHDKAAARDINAPPPPSRRDTLRQILQNPRPVRAWPSPARDLAAAADELEAARRAAAVPSLTVEAGATYTYRINPVTQAPELTVDLEAMPAQPPRRG